MERYQAANAALILSGVRPSNRVFAQSSAPPAIPSSAFDDYMDAVQERAELEPIGQIKVRRMRRSDYDD